MVVDLLYMDRLSKDNMCITENFSSKGARNETALTTLISVPKRSHKQYKIKHGMVYFGGRWSRTF